jgi:hypothetical protein
MKFVILTHIKAVCAKFMVHTGIGFAGVVGFHDMDGGFEPVKVLAPFVSVWPNLE